MIVEEIPMGRPELVSRDPTPHAGICTGTAPVFPCVSPDFSRREENGGAHVAVQLSPAQPRPLEPPGQDWCCNEWW